MTRQGGLLQKNQGFAIQREQPVLLGIFVVLFRILSV